MLNIDIGRYSSILKEIERNEASIFLIKKNGQSFDSNLNYLNKSSNSEYNTFIQTISSTPFWNRIHHFVH